jgi:excisionase family DNA binding protein
MPQDNPRYLTTKEAAAYLRVSEGALRMAIHRGHVAPSGRLGSRLRFTRDDLDAAFRTARGFVVLTDHGGAR